MFSLTVIQFANNYIPVGTKIMVIKSHTTIFKGTLEDLYYTDEDVRSSVVTMVAGNSDGYLCLSCR